MREPARRFRGGALVLVLAGALLLAACSGGGSGSSGSAASTTTSAAARGPGTQTSTITISNFMFSPMSAVVTAGAMVTVTNKDSVTHTLTATNGQFDTGNIAGGQSKTFTAPSKAGTYHYICNIHQYMMGTIVVR